MKIRKAILTGGGRATRLHPITTTINKHLLPLANKPMIFHAIEKVVKAGVTDIYINLNPGETELQKYIGDGGHWGVKITFFEQTGGPQGIAHVVNEAKAFIGDDPFLFYLSDNIILGDITDLVHEFEAGNHHAMMTLSKVPDPQRFGVPVFDAYGTLVDVLEKPENPPSNFAVTGIYLFGPKVFFDAFPRIQKSARGEYEIPSIYSHFLKNGLSVGHKEITGWWKDTGKLNDLITANRLLLDELPNEGYPNHGTVEPGAKITGKVRVGIGACVSATSTIVGPAIIGENCIIENATIGPYVTIGGGTEIRGAKIYNSIILEHGKMVGDMEISESLIGKQVEMTSKGAKKKYSMMLGDKTVLRAE